MIKNRKKQRVASSVDDCASSLLCDDVVLPMTTCQHQQQRRQTAVTFSRQAARRGLSPMHTADATQLSSWVCIGLYRMTVESRRATTLQLMKYSARQKRWSTYQRAYYGRLSPVPPVSYGKALTNKKAELTQGLVHDRTATWRLTEFGFFNSCDSKSNLCCHPVKALEHGLY